MEEVFGSKETAADLEGARAEVERYKASQANKGYEAEHVDH
jgi:hypothetical protein